MCCNHARGQSKAIKTELKQFSLYVHLFKISPVHGVWVELNWALLGELGVEEVLVVAHRHLGELLAVGQDLEELVGGRVGAQARVEVLHRLRAYI